MKIQGSPREEIVTLRGKLKRRILIARADDNGVIEVSEEVGKVLIGRGYVEIEETLKKCKKCEFECDNQGELLAHYRSAHPKVTK